MTKNSQRPESVETVQGGVPPYGVKYTLVVNGKYAISVIGKRAEQHYGSGPSDFRST